MRSRILFRGFVVAVAIMVILGLSTAAVGSGLSERSFGDLATTARVKMMLLTESPLIAMNVKVETHNGIVHLHGAVDSKEQKSKAAQLAGQVDDVRQVNNFLTIKGSPDDSKILQDNRASY